MIPKAVSDKGVLQSPLAPDSWPNAKTPQDPSTCRRGDSGEGNMLIWSQAGWHTKHMLAFKYRDKQSPKREKKIKNLLFSFNISIAQPAPPFPKLVLLIMLYNACSGETVRGIPPRLFLTLGGCWPTYAQRLQASMWGIIVPHPPGVFFL